MNASTTNNTAPQSSEPILKVQGLCTNFHTARGIVHAVQDVNFEVHKGETLGLVGESGSGKSVTAMSLLNLVREPGKVEAGEIRFRGRNILAMSGEEIRSIRGNSLSMVFQDAMSSLNPIMRIGEQIIEAIHGKGNASSVQIKERAVQLMKIVGIPDPSLRLMDYPHRFSGGMRQRVMIAMALANEPDVIIADEPTTALDVTVQAQILDVLRNINEQLGTAIILITHNLGVVTRSCDRVAVMYAGRIVEQAPTAELFATPCHPYTQALLAATPRLFSSRRDMLRPIEGQPPSLINIDPGCSFSSRCSYADDICHNDKPLTSYSGTRSFACWKTARGEALLPINQQILSPAKPRSSIGSDTIAHNINKLDLLEVKDLSVSFEIPSSSFNPFSKNFKFKAVDNVSFKIGYSETVGLVGESGCGKSTLSKAIMGINSVGVGEVLFDGQNITHIVGKSRKSIQQKLQMVFQDPMSSLNPRMTIYDAISEPLIVHGLCKETDEVKKQVDQLMKLVGLDPVSATRYPHEFSGGQRQRIVIARALAVKPKLLVCDEAVAALDVSFQAQVINLLKSVQTQLGLSILFIGHDLATVRYISDRILVMYLGQIVEEGPAESITSQPQHPYTVCLLSAVPEPDPLIEVSRQRLVLKGDLPSPLDPPSGCRFRTRCPIGPTHFKERDICISQIPSLKSSIDTAGCKVACHFPGEMKLFNTTSSVKPSKLSVND